MKIFTIALGVLTALGGFLDIGDIVFATDAGARFKYQLIWVVVVGVIGIVIYSEMVGRVASASKRGAFAAVRERLGVKVGFACLIGGQFSCAATLAAEIGGVAIVLQLLTAVHYYILLVVVFVGLLLVLWFFPFEGIEYVFGWGGTVLLVLVVAVVKAHPTWHRVASGLVPRAYPDAVAIHLYYIVGLLAAAFTPYHMYFYSSGGIEEGWEPEEQIDNKSNTFVGYPLGGLLSIALIVLAGTYFFPRGIEPSLLGTPALAVAVAVGGIGLILFLVGAFFSIGGAALETALSAGYNLSQYLGWEWGKERGHAAAPRFTLTWLVVVVGAFCVILSGIDPLLVTEYAVIFSAIATPLTYLPVVLVANDENYMGEYKNGRIRNILAFIYIPVILFVSLAGVPLLFITHMGNG